MRGKAERNGRGRKTDPEGSRRAKSLGARVAADLLDRLTSDERARWVVYLDSRVRQAGDVLDLAGTHVALDQDAMIAFVDEAPGANWHHPCHYLIAPVRGGETRRYPAGTPPSLDGLPPTWRVLWKPTDCEPWKLIPIRNRRPDRPLDPQEDR